MDTKKYIIEIPDNTAWLQWVKVSDKDGHVYFDFKDPEDLTLYTEPDVERNMEEAFKNGYDAACKDIDVKSKTNAAYQKGLEDAWDAARKIVLSREDGGLFGYEERKAVFGCGNYMALKTFLAPEAIEKIRQYEQENEGLGIQGYFKRGDEVIDADGTKAVILRVSEDNYCQVYTKNGCIYNWHIHTYKFHKTGRNFPEIAEVLKKMQEG